jgi:hypothetical protein
MQFHKYWLQCYVNTWFCRTIWEQALNLHMLIEQLYNSIVKVLRSGNSTNFVIAYRPPCPPCPPTVDGSLGSLHIWPQIKCLALWLDLEGASASLGNSDWSAGHSSGSWTLETNGNDWKHLESGHTASAAAVASAQVQGWTKHNQTMMWANFVKLGLTPPISIQCNPRNYDSLVWS